MDAVSLIIECSIYYMIHVVIEWNMCMQGMLIQGRLSGQASKQYSLAQVIAHNCMHLFCAALPSQLECRIAGT